MLKSKDIENHDLHIIHFSPAMNRKQALHKLAFKRIDVFASKTDMTVYLAKLLFRHPWGNAGQKGFISNDDRYWLHGFTGVGHSAWFWDPPRALAMNKIQNIRKTM